MSEEIQMRTTIISRKFSIWEGLVDSSIYFALAGMKAQGLSAKKAKECLKRRWQKASAEHHKANLEIIRRLYAKGG